jgi:integrase
LVGLRVRRGLGGSGGAGTASTGSMPVLVLYWAMSGLVFTTSVGTPMDPAAVYRHHQDICDLADVRYIRFHDLRHTCATLLLE